ncbi:hypothetical protein LL912_03620 [Niabella sp. CC-SYL272]|uniref:hypothetical protein n=1 Tax=Niabella agricola TaxID=2891571 RepID=UPI001F2D8F76|nr:hypothetical protein [Niabella agricola]MCF3107859.1 hypothetical protein [Niabella agricola]
MLQEQWKSAVTAINALLGGYYNDLFPGAYGQSGSTGQMTFYDKDQLFGYMSGLMSQYGYWDAQRNWARSPYEALRRYQGGSSSRLTAGMWNGYMQSVWRNYAFDINTTDATSVRYGSGFQTVGLTFANANLGAAAATFYSYGKAEALFFQQQNEANRSVGEPGLGESLIPIWGNGRSAINAFQNGNWGWGLFHTAMAVSDVFLVKSLVTGAAQMVVGATINKKTADQIALKELVHEASLGGRKALSAVDTKAAIELAKDVKYPGFRATPSDMAPFNNHWIGGPHIHIPGVGNGHIPIVR